MSYIYYFIAIFLSWIVYDYFYGETKLGHAIKTSCLSVLSIMIGGVFYLALKIANLFQDSEEIKEYVFYEIKNLLDQKLISYHPALNIVSLNALLKVEDDSSINYYVVVNHDYRTIFKVHISNADITIDKAHLKFFNDELKTLPQLLAYVNTQTCLKIRISTPLNIVI